MDKKIEADKLAIRQQVRMYFGDMSKKFIVELKFIEQAMEKAIPKLNIKGIIKIKKSKKVKKVKNESTKQPKVKKFHWKYQTITNPRTGKVYTTRIGTGNGRYF